MMFNEGTAWDLWWTGQEFKGMRVEACEQMLTVGEDVMAKYRAANFDIMVAHFHDLCPIALANQLNIKKVFLCSTFTERWSFLRLYVYNKYMGLVRLCKQQLASDRMGNSRNVSIRLQRSADGIENVSKFRSASAVLLR